MYATYPFAGDQIQKRDIGTDGLSELDRGREGECGWSNSGLPRAAQSHSGDAARVIEEIRSSRPIQTNSQRIREWIQHRRGKVRELGTHLFSPYSIAHVVKEGEKSDTPYIRVEGP